MNTDTKNRILATSTLAALLFIGGGIAAAPATRPAQRVDLPSAASPATSAKSTIVPIPYRPWLPPARTPGLPRVAPSDGQHALRPRPALDIPPLAESSGDLPSEPQLQVVPPVRIAARDPADLPVATIAAKADGGNPTLATDPTLDLAPPGALVLSPPPRMTQPAPLLLPIPDPSHQSGAVPASQPATENAPLTTFDPPGPTTLPVGK
jgi:hypothetical protein